MSLSVANSSTTATIDDGSRPLWIFFILGCLFTVVPLVNSVLHVDDNKDYSHWYKFGTYVREGRPLYQDSLNGEVEYTYPPTAAVLFYAPLSLLPPFGFVLVLGLLSAAAWSYCLWSSVVLVAREWNSRSVLVAVLPGLAVAPYVWDIQFLGQLNLLLLALVLGAFVSLRRGDRLLAGGLFGAAVALKAFPLPAIAYFVVRRQWGIVLTSIASIVFFAWFLPGIVRGFDRNNLELRQWAAAMVGDQSGENMGARSSIGFSRHNQSLVSCAHRLLRHVNAQEPQKEPFYVNIANVAPRTAQLIGYSGCLLMGLILLLVCRFHFAPSIECEGLEVAMVITLVPLCSPLSWTYFFCWLLPAWAAIGYWLNNPRLPSHIRPFVIGGALLATLLLASAISEQFNPTLQALGVTSFGTVALFLTLAVVRFTQGRRAEMRVGSVNP